MKETFNSLQVVFAAVGGCLGWFFGGFDGFLYVLLAFVIVDYITGLMCAVIDKKLSSEIGFKGIFKKVLIFIMVGIGNILDVQFIGDGNALRTAIIFFLHLQRRSFPARKCWVYRITDSRKTESGIGTASRPQ